jgi:hypothetical protein
MLPTHRQEVEAILAGAQAEHAATLEHVSPAVLHGRVFGRAPLSPDTVLAAFVDGARVTAGAALRETYAAQERAVVHIAAHLDAVEPR